MRAPTDKPAERYDDRHYPQTQATKEVGAVVVSHKRLDLAAACCAAMMRELPGASIVVILNASGDVADDDLRGLTDEGIRVVCNARPVGYGANLNAGARILGVGYRYYLLLNDDVIPHRGAVAALVRTLSEAGEGAALAGPRIVNDAGDPQPSAFRFPTIWSELAQAIALPSSWQRFVMRHFVLDSPDPAGRVDWMLGAALLVCASHFKAIGGFDEDYFLYFEETDLAYRLRSRGWTSHFSFDPDALFTHTGGASTEGGSFQRQYLRSCHRYLANHHGPVVANVALGLRRSSLKVRAAKALIYGAVRRSNDEASHGRALLELSRRDPLSNVPGHEPNPPASAPTTGCGGRVSPIEPYSDGDARGHSERQT